jgi:hypothetical protein
MEPDSDIVERSNSAEPLVAIVPADLLAFVTEFGDGAGKPAELVVLSTCVHCRETTFWMQCSEEDGVAQRTCTGCKATAFIGDSEAHWDDADTGDAQCPCGKKVFQLGIGYCLDAGHEITWIIVGAKCVACAEVGVYTDWFVDYEPSRHLLDQS